MRNPTLSDVAKAAGVSYATADRVINSRGNVAEKSVRKVKAAVTQLGYVRDLAAANLSRGRTHRLAVVLPAGSNAFFAKMRDALKALAVHLAAERVDIKIVEVPAFSSDRLRVALDGLAGTAVDGVAIVGQNGAGLDASLADLQAEGLAIVSLVSDLPKEHRDAYIGINNLAAGRTAGRLMGMAHRGDAGQVLVLAGSLEVEDHVQRLQGFREVIKADFPHLHPLEVVLTRDEKDLVRNAVNIAFERSPKVTAIYNVGAGNTGLVSGLQAHAANHKPICVVHELVPHSRVALESGLVQFVIDQRPDIEVARAVTILRALIDGRAMPPMPELVPMIYVPDNLPSVFESPTVRVSTHD